MKRRAYRRRETIWLALSAFIVVSMLCSLVMLVRPAPAVEATPPPATTEPPTATPAPTVTPTPGQAAAPPGSIPGAAPDFTFAVAGDSRDGDAVFEQILRQISDERPAFLIHTGDLVGRGSEEAFKVFRGLLAGFEVPFYPVPGNHDGSVTGKLDDYLQYSGAPAAHYAFDYGQAHFAFVDSHSGSLSPGETAWLDEDLAAARQPLKIVILHHPPFDPNGSSHIMASGNRAFMQLMQRRGVRYVFAGHIHAYAAEEREGVTYIIAGGAGAPLIPDETRGGFHHYLRVRVRGTDLSYEVVRVATKTSRVSETLQISLGAPRLQWRPVFGTI